MESQNEILYRHQLEFISQRKLLEKIQRADISKFLY